ncbi:hypothetical protein OPW41_08885 [Vibrio europaeus]|uniref:hypothetical protein n=1 Tax=Vibrio europaeus TaxID=300876 RepID=UPI00233F19F6|nr:hypothetical protein [Vibrio europaeus]MDC5755222.1 hypothetical protein [Vibrio europaeus]MDC5775801.1 hypothetical protein [Vibrio europaeus]MDC5794939.1 hypothetical protein [Vibrio europaeus]MDC5799510.1 hypothetical protein [Vibrio europaeus]MDC5817218.1 hypothetical protein [Vibrio europaeus]
MSKLNTEIVINVGGNLAAKSKQYGKASQQFAKKHKTSMAVIRTSSRAAGRALDGLANKYTGLLSGVAAMQSIRGVADFDAQMTRLGTNAMMTIDEVEKLKARIFEVANMDGIQINVDELVKAVDTLMTDTGDKAFMEENLENLAVLIQATGAAAEDAGLIMGAMQKKNVKSQEDVNALLDRFLYQMSKGSVSIKEASGEARQLFSLYQGEGVQSMSQLFALMQMFTSTTGTASEGVTALGAAFSDLMNPQNIAFLRNSGINIYKQGTKELREPVELFIEILNAAANSEEELGKVFSDTARRGFKSLLSQENKNKLLDMVNGMVDLGAANKAAEQNAATLNSTFTKLSNIWKDYSNSAMSKPIQAVADAINSIDKETLNNLITAGLALGGGLIGFKVLKAGKNTAQEIYQDIKGTGKSSSSIGGLMSAGVVDVYVTNMADFGQGRSKKDKIRSRTGRTKVGKQTPSRADTATTVTRPNLGLGRVVGGLGSAAALYESSHFAAEALYNSTGIGNWAKQHQMNWDQSTLDLVKKPSINDVWTEIKGFFSKLEGGNNNSFYPHGYIPSSKNRKANEPPLQVEQNGRIDISISDDRATLKRFEMGNMYVRELPGQAMID